MGSQGISLIELHPKMIMETIVKEILGIGQSLVLKKVIN
jgi:hypothetical protein